MNTPLPSTEWATARRERLDRLEAAAQDPRTSGERLRRIRRNVLAHTLANIAGPGPDCPTPTSAQHEIDWMTATIANPRAVQNRMLVAIGVAWFVGILTGLALFWVWTR